MAIYEVDGKRYEIDDSIQGQKLLDTLNQLKSQNKYSSVDIAQSIAAPTEIAASMITGAAGDVASGLAGTAAAFSPFLPEGAGAETQKAVEDFFNEYLVYEPRTRAAQDILKGLQPVGEFFQDLERAFGEAGYELAGSEESQISPIFGSIGATVPGLIAELPIFKGPKAAARAARIQSAKFADEAAQLEAQTQTPESTAEVIAQGQPEDVVLEADVDPDFYKAADELGISTEPLAGYASRNPQYRGVEQGLASIPESALNVQGKAFVTDLAQKADDIIEQYGGTLDKSELSEQFRNDSIKTIEDLNIQSDELYNRLDQMIPKASRVKASNAETLLNDVVSEFGGDFKKIPPVYKKLRQLKSSRATESKRNPLTGKVTETTTESLPTYAEIDQLRRSIGQAINKKSGPFKDAETGALKRVYGALKRDIDSIAKEFDAESISESASSLVRQRKHIEDNLTKLLGREMAGDLAPKARQAVLGLTKSSPDVGRFNAFMNKVPAEFRSRVAVSALNDIFGGTGTGQKSLSTNQFVSKFEELNKNKKAKQQLYKYLPDGAKKDLDNMFKLAKGVDTALKDKIPTGLATRFFDENNGFMRRMLGKGVEYVVASKTGPLGASVVSELLSGSGNAARATSEILASPQFQGMIRQAISEGVAEGASKSKKLEAMERNLTNSKRFKDWADSLDDASAAQLASQGVISYLLTQDGQDSETEQQ